MKMKILSNKIYEKSVWHLEYKIIFTVYVKYQIIAQISTATKYFASQNVEQITNIRPFYEANAFQFFCR